MTDEVKALLAKAKLSGKTELYIFKRQGRDEPTSLPIFIGSWGSEQGKLIAQNWSLQGPLRDVTKPHYLFYEQSSELFHIGFTTIPSGNGKRPRNCEYTGELRADDEEAQAKQELKSGGVIC